MILPLALPGVVAGSIFTFSLTLGDYIVPPIVGPSSLILGQAVYTQQGTAGNIPLAAAFSVVPIVDHGCFSVRWRSAWGRSMRSDDQPRQRRSVSGSRRGGLLFLHLPLAFILLYAFTTEESSFQFPPPGLHRQWFGVAW